MNQVEHLAPILDRLPRRLEQQPLLRVHEIRLPGGNPEKPGIELVDPADKPAPACAALSRLARLGIVIARDVPSAGRNLAGGVDAIAEQPPEGAGSVRIAREAAPDADDRDGQAGDGSLFWHAVLAGRFCGWLRVACLRPGLRRTGNPPGEGQKGNHQAGRTAGRLRGTGRVVHYKLRCSNHNVP